MKGKINILARKTFALIIATAMSMPTGVMAAGEEVKTYDDTSSIMTLNQKIDEKKNLERSVDNSKNLETDSYKLDLRAKLEESLDKITYQVKITNKSPENGDRDLNLRLTPNPNSNIKDLRLLKAMAKIDGKL